MFWSIVRFLQRHSFTLHFVDICILNILFGKRFKWELHVKQVISSNSVDGLRILCFKNEFFVKEGVDVYACLFGSNYFLVKSGWVSLHLLHISILDILSGERLQRKLHVQHVVGWDPIDRLRSAKEWRSIGSIWCQRRCRHNHFSILWEQTEFWRSLSL